MAESIPISIPTFDFSVESYHKLVSSGVLKPTDKVELIEGKIIPMSPINSPHAACVERLGELLRQKKQDNQLVRSQNPITLGTHSEPEPDLALVKYRADFYEDNHPTAADVFIAIEVSYSTQKYDRETKIPLFAQYGIPEAWVVDLKAKTIEVYANPMNGEYGDKKTFKREDVLESRYFERLLVSRVIK